MSLFCVYAPPGVEIDDEQAEKIFTAKDAIEFLKKGMDVE